MDYRKFIEDCDAILDAGKTGEHYKYTSGEHGGIYIEKSRLLKNPIIASKLASELTQKICEYGPNGIIKVTDTSTIVPVKDIDIFLGAMTGGVKFANYVALSYIYILINSAFYDPYKEIMCIEAKKQKPYVHCNAGEYGGEREVVESHFILTKDHKADIKDKKVFIIEDIINTGYTISGLADLVVINGGEIAGVGAIWNRGGIKITKPFYCLVNEKLESWNEKDCPFCKKGIPLSKTYGYG